MKDWHICQTCSHLALGNWREVINVKPLEIASFHLCHIFLRLGKLPHLTNQLCKTVGDAQHLQEFCIWGLHLSNLPKKTPKEISNSFAFGVCNLGNLAKNAKPWTTLQTRSREQSHARGKRARLEIFYFYPFPSPNVNSLADGLFLFFAFCYGSLQIATNAKSICQSLWRWSKHLQGLCIFSFAFDRVCKVPNKNGKDKKTWSPTILHFHLAFWGNFEPTLFSPEGFSLGARFSSSSVIFRASRAFVSRHSSLSRRRPVQVLAPCRLVLTHHEPCPVLNLARPGTSPRPEPLWQSFAAKLGEARAWRSHAGGRNAARVARAWGRSRFAKSGGLGIYVKSRPLNVKLCKL